MKIDASHRRWLAISIVVAVVAAAVYVPYSRNPTEGPRGGSWIGLAFGSAGFAMILFAGILGLRKKLLLLRIGSLAFWMKGHSV